MGQSYSLTCGVTGAESLSPSITYQWTKNNGTQTQIQNDAANPRISFSPLRLSDAGRYTCQTTVSSPYLNNDITMMDTQDVTLQSEFMNSYSQLSEYTSAIGMNYQSVVCHSILGNN